MPVSLKIRNPGAVEDAILDGIGARPTIKISLSITGPASQYALVWEWGSVRLSKPGPKTTWGENPDGDRVILTKTAPYGYIRTNLPEMRKIIREEFETVDWAGVPLRKIGKTVTETLELAGGRIAELIAQSAPYDTGELREAIEVARVSPDETVDLLSVRPRLAL